MAHENDRKKQGLFGSYIFVQMQIKAEECICFVYLWTEESKRFFIFHSASLCLRAAMRTMFAMHKLDMHRKQRRNEVKNE